MAESELRILTIDIVLGISLICLLVMYHLHHREQVVFTKLLEVLGKLVHVNLPVLLVIAQ